MPEVALSFPYCNLQDVQQETRNDDSDKADWFRECINNASRWIDGYCKRDFKYHDHLTSGITVSPRDICDRTIVLDGPIISLTEVAIDGTLLDADEFAFDGKTIYTRVQLPDDPAEPLVTIKVAYGYDFGQNEDTPSASLPFEVRRACTLIAAAFTVQNRREVISPEGGNVESLLDTKVPAEALKYLKKFKRPVL